MTFLWNQWNITEIKLDIKFDNLREKKCLFNKNYDQLYNFETINSNEEAESQNFKMKTQI